jgi:phage/plasmid-like protein (TIGR03299 family)
MSTETLEWLNRNVLVGFTDHRGTAWHYKQSAQGLEPNHYPGAIPVEDIRRRLFSWSVIPAPAAAVLEGPSGPEVVTSTNRVALVRSDTKSILAFHGPDYEVHQFNEWLVDRLAGLVDDGLNFASAGLLKGGRVGFVSLELTDSLEPVEGFGTRPMLLAASSHDSSYATQFKVVQTFVVCDNTLKTAIWHERKPAPRHAKFYHSKSARRFRYQDVRDALRLVFEAGGESSEWIRALSSTKVSEPQFLAALDILFPAAPEIHDPADATAPKNEHARELIVASLRHDPRVAPWAGTALGALQAFNTYYLHERPTRTNRVERNYLDQLSRRAERRDRRVVDALVRAGVEMP